MSNTAKPESQVAAPAAAAPSHDPYNTADSRPFLDKLEKQPPRRTLDHMRNLSAEIKRTRDLKK